MTDLNDMLERLGLSQYLQAFLNEGFDTWDTLMDITESDLEELHVKLGHRRKLQRAIIQARGQTRDNIRLGAPQHLGPKEDTYRSGEESGTSLKDQKKAVLVNGINTGGQKRKYRRHPKPDEYAPERPPSAYVIFSNQMRDRLKGQDLSFTEIAKIVGERWQVLSVHEKEPCERQAQTMKEKYYADLTEYKKTPQYAQYQEYLVDFKAKHSQQQDNKKSKSELEAQDQPRNESLDPSARAQNSPPTPNNANDPPPNEWRGSVSPTAHDQQRTHSPCLDGKSSTVPSPSVSNFRRYPTAPSSEESNLVQDSKRRALPSHHIYNGQATRSDGSHQTSPNIAYTRPHLYESQYSPPRGAKMVGEALPPLAREDLKSVIPPEPAHGGSPWVSQAYTLPALDSSKANTSRMLPVPMAFAGSLNGLMPARPLESRSATTALPSHNSNHHTDGHDKPSKSSIATLLRAGEELDRGSWR